MNRPSEPKARPRRSISERGAVALALAGICAAYLVHVSMYDFISDDAFIALRYARNLLEGHGLVFNPGERVEGFTTLLWVLLLAGVGSLGMDLLASSRILGVLAGLITIVLTCKLASRARGTEGSSMWLLLAPSMLALNGSFACWAAAGLETPLFVCLVVGGFLACLCDRYWLSACLAALSALTRPEGMIVLGLLGLYQVFRERSNAGEPQPNRNSLTQALSQRERDLGFSQGSKGGRRWIGWWALSGGVLAGLFLFRILYFGDLLPNTYYAKAGASWAQVKRGLVYLAQYSTDHESIGLMIVPVGYFLLRGPRALRLLCAGVAVLWCASIWVGGDGLPMYRFALAPLPILLVLQAVLLERLYRHSASRFFRNNRLIKALLFLTVVVWGTVHVTPPAIGSHFVNYEYQKEVEIPRWSGVGLWLRENAAEGESLAAVPIGAVSYYSGLIAYDMLGLTDRHIAHLDMPGMGLGWAGHEKHDGQYILGRRPTYLLLGNIDVTARPRDPRGRPFIPYANRNIFAREKDIYEGSLLVERYRPRSVRLETGEYFNFYELKQTRP